MPRLQGKKFLLTYPQCTLTTTEVSQKLQAITTIVTFTIASELHQDGTPHIHAVLILQSSPGTSNMRYFDIDGFHPNIKTLKTLSDVERASKYVQKDGNYITNVESRLKGRALLFDCLIKNPGGLTITFVKEHPEIMALNFDSLRKWMSFVHPTLQIPPVQFLPKRRHIWLHGPSNSGKSYWLNAFICCFFQPEEIPRNNDYNGVHISTDLLYFDEYRGQLDVQTLNRLCDGRTKLNTKGSSTWIAYPQIVIVSNFTLQEVYCKADPEEIASLLNRFQQYDSSRNLPKFPTREL